METKEVNKITFEEFKSQIISDYRTAFMSREVSLLGRREVLTGKAKFGIFGDGKEFGVNIEYVLENQRMGTAGALSLLKDKPNEPFFVMNGDLLTNVNFEHLHNYHIATNSMATMCVREYDFQVPYGVVNIKDSKIVSIEEKPIHKFFVSAGIYMLSSEVLNYIPKNEFFDMPTLFEKLISLNKNTVSFPIREYWLDIGRMEEYKKANDEYSEVF